MLGRWQQPRVGVGMLLRLAADTLACTARSGARVKGGGGQQLSLRTAHVAGSAGQRCGESSGAALLEALGLLLSTIVGCWG
jgi:hypothetical protein